MPVAIQFKTIYIKNLCYRTDWAYVMSWVKWRYCNDILLFSRSISLSIYLSIYLYIYLSIYGSTALCWMLAAFSVSWSSYTVGRTPLTGDQTVARPLPSHKATQTKTFMPQGGFETTIPVFERAKAVHALDITATGFSRSLLRIIFFILVCGLFSRLSLSRLHTFKYQGDSWIMS
jgi:hypothetical protein